MNTLTYQVCNLIIEQNEKGRFSPSEIAKDMLDFFTKKNRRCKHYGIYGISFKFFGKRKK